MTTITSQMLLDYVNDALPEREMALIERSMRESPELRRRLEEVLGQVDRGEHTVGAIWRRERVSCPSRDHLGGYIFGSLDAGLEDYIQFHLDIIGCPYCRANLDDLERIQGK